MENKPSMSRVERLHREKVTRYSIRKYSFGAASVAVAALFMFLGNGAVSANELSKQETSVEAPAPSSENQSTSESIPAAQPIAEEPTAKPAEATTPALDKTQLESYISEIETKLSNGSYANKTEESVAVLKADLEAAKATLANATTQAELKSAYSKLVTTVNSKLKNKPVEKKETPAVDTTEGKETVGKKADNTEKNPESNSIENTGSKDERNGKELDKNNAFRAETDTEKPKVSIDYDDPASKTFWVTPTEETNITGRIKITDNSGKIVKGWMQKMGSGTETDIGYGLHNSNIDGETPATADQPATLSVTGTLQKLHPNGKPWPNGSTVVSRKVRAKDASNNEIDNEGASDPDAQVWFKIRSQNVKYANDLTNKAENFDKIVVTDTAQLQQDNLDTIKTKLQEGADNNLNGKIDTVTQVGDKIVVTYNDGTTTERPVTDFARVNVKPVGNIPFSNSTTKEIYVYKGEETNIELSATDDSGKVKDIRVGEGSRGNNAPGAAGARINNQYGLTFSYQRNENDGIVATQDNPAKVTITGTVSVPGKPTYTGKLVTRYLIAEDLDGATFSEPLGNQESANPLPEGYFKLMVREQTQKYDIQAQTNEAGKISVADVNNLSQADFEKIKNNIKIKYNTADDARLLDKNGKLVENASNYIDTITKQGDQIVVTYKDGSTDSVALTSVLRNNPAPTVEVPYSNLAEKQVYVYTGENTDLTFKATDDAGIKDMYLRGPGGITGDNTAGYGFTTGKINNEAVTNGVGTVSDDKRTATIKMTGVTTLTAPNRWTSFIAANDNDDASSMPADRDFNALDVDPDAKSKPGYVQFIVKNQTSKYDIATPTEKVAVVDPDNVTEADLAKIKEKLKLEYSNSNDDANLADKKGKSVDDKDSKIKSVTKDDQGNLVVTYTDGSTDKRPLSEFVSLDKQPAINAVNKAAEDKIAEINKTPNATDEEKAAAIAKVNADKEKAVAAINDANVTTKDAIDKAQDAGTDAIAKDTPVVAKKDEAKKAIDKALEDKNKAIDDRTDLTPAEKTAAKQAAEKAADDAKQAIDAATTDAAVDTAKNAGTGEIAKVNPVAKEAAKQAIADELAEKEKAIDARQDLTEAEKSAAKKEAQDKAQEATDVINAQPSNAETPEKAAEAQTAVDGAKDKGVADVKAVNPVAKAAAKQAIADELAEKEKAIDARTDLTQEEKDAAKKEAQDKAKEATDAIDAQPNNAETPEKAAEAQTAVDGAKDKGVADVKAVDPVAVTKPAAKKAIEDKLAKQLEDIANTPDATDDEKKVAADAAKALADEAKEEIDKAGTDAEVKRLQDEAEGEIEKSVPVVEDKPNARKAIDEEAIAKKAAIDARDDLTPKAKEDLKAQVDKIAEQAKKSVDAAKTAEAVNGIEESDKAAIKAVGEVNIPADKVLVNDPSALTDAEKAKVLEAVKKVNPDAKEITQDADGNITVTTPDGHQEIITPEQVVKTAATANDPKAGNDVVKPADKVVVNDPAKLTDAEKEKIKAAVEAVNPNSVVTVDEKGNAKVSTPDGQTQVIPVEELVRTVEDTKKPNAGNDIVKPADKTVVANPEALTPEEKKAIEDKVKAVNPGATVVVDDKGNATVTTPAGKTAVIPAADLTKSAADAAKPNAGNDVVKPADKTVVANPEALTPEEKKAIEDKVKAVNPGATVVVDDKGNATVTTPAGKTAVIPASDLTKSAADAAKPNAGNDIVKPADKTVVANPEALTPEEKKAIEDKVKAVNPGATVVVDDKGNATVTTPAGKTAVIPASDLTKSAADAAKPNAGNDVVKPADKTVVANPEALTPEEKKAIEDKVKAVNPGATVVVDDKGNTTVTTPAGKTAVIPAADLTKSAADAAKPNAGNDVVKPADKTVVANPEALTPEEKKAIEDKVKAVNPGATVVVDDKGNATVTTPAGKTAVIPASDLTKSAADAAKPNAGNDVVKPADKTVVANPEALTPEEKKAIEDKVKAVNPGATVVVDDKGNATVTTPAGKTAVIPASDLTKSAADAAKPNAGNDIVKPADKTVVANPEALTPEEKKAIEDKVKAVNPGATVVVDDKGNATVTTPAGKTAVIPASDLTKSAADAAKPNAGNDVVKPADKTVVANPEALTPEEKKAIEDKVKAVNPGATVVVDDKGNTTVTTPAGKTAVIPAADLTKSAADAAKPNAGNDVVKPADKTVVANPEALTPEEKKAIEDKVKAVNPGATVVVDDKGNATVTTPAGKTAVIPASDLTKSAADAAKPNAGNDIVKPADKTVVANPEALTPEEKKAIEDKVKAVNPGATVVVDDKGNATVTTPAGKTAVIPASDLTKSAADAAKPNAGNDVVKPADKTVVANPEALTPEEKKAIEDKVKAVNPGATVVVDDKGNTTVTTPAGKTAVIPAADLTKSAADAAKPNAGNDVVKPADKTVVANPEALTPEEKKAIEDKVKAVNPGATVVVDDKGNATVTTPAGKTAVIPASDLTKSAADAAKPNAGNDVVKPADKTVVANPEALTPEEKKAIEDKVKAVNPGATVVVDDKGNTTVTTPAGKTAVIPAADLTKSAADAAKPNAGDDIVKPADKTVVANPESLTPEEKKAIEDKVKAVNPGATVVVDDKGNTTVTTPAGKTAVIPAADLTKSAADAAKPNAGNDVVKPADKTVVANPEALTPEEKKAIEDKVKAVNPGATVVVDDKGNATVTTPAGKTAVIPAADLTKSAADAAKENAGNAVNTPAGKVEVKDPANLTDEEKAKVKEAIEAVNPGSKVVVDEKGNATVTTPAGKTAVIPAADLTKSAADAAKPNAGNAVNTPATRVLVGDKAKLTADEIEKVKESIKAVNPGATVVVDENGNATVTTPAGKTATIPAAQLVKDAKDVAAKNNGENINVDFEKETVADLNNLTGAEKEAAKAKIKGANAEVVEVVFDKAGNATVITKDGKVYTIVAKDIFKQRPSTDNGSSANAGQTASAQANARKAAKELPNTGTADSTVAMVAAAASALLGLGLAGRRRKEDEEA